MELKEKVAYLKGMADMAGIDPATKEGKLTAALLDVLEEMSNTVSDLVKANTEMCELLDTIDQDLGDVESVLFDDDDEEEDEDGDMDFDDEDDGEIYEAVCPSCGETVYIDEEMLDEGEMVCPSCGENLEFDLDISGESDPEEDSQE